MICLDTGYRKKLNHHISNIISCISRAQFDLKGLSISTAILVKSQNKTKYFRLRLDKVSSDTQWPGRVVPIKNPIKRIQNPVFWPKSVEIGYK